VVGGLHQSAAFLLVFEIRRPFYHPPVFDVSLVSASSYVATARPHDLTVHARTWMSRFFYLVAHPFFSFFLSFFSLSFEVGTASARQQKARTTDRPGERGWPT
jgi:hypothetical protein